MKRQEATLCADSCGLSALSLPALMTVKGSPSVKKQLVVSGEPMKTAFCTSPITNEIGPVTGTVV
jgi:hypothetical protein